MSEPNAPQKPTFKEWLITGIALLLGITGLVTAGLKHYGITAEDDLTLLEGVPKDVTITEIRGRRGYTSFHLKFSLQDHAIQYSSDQPIYPTIVSEAQSKVPLQAWVSTSSKDLYKLGRKNGHLILTYGQTVKYWESGARFCLIFGIVVFPLGLLSLIQVIRRNSDNKRWEHCPANWQTRVPQ